MRVHSLLLACVLTLLGGCAAYESRIVESGDERGTLEPGPYANPRIPAAEYCQERGKVAVLENVTYQNEQARYHFFCAPDVRPVIGPWSSDA